jgi:predicted anti-sigma-YlaC factor YlaD
MMLRLLDKLTLLGIALGVAMMLQPWWPSGFAVGFFVTIGSTVLQIVTGHVVNN